MTDHTNENAQNAPDPDGWWIDLPNANLIGHAVDEAHTAFDATYYQSESAADLRENVTRTIVALTRVLQILPPDERGA